MKYSLTTMTLTCPGMYCGRIFQNGSFSDCGACPLGYRVNNNFICDLCEEDLKFYDWMYLTFMAFLPLFLNWTLLENTIKTYNAKVILLYVIALIEIVLSQVATLLLLSPIGRFNAISCPSLHLYDWYTLFFNPSPDFINVLHCTQEAVYPRYSMVFIFYAFSLLQVLFIRTVIVSKLVSSNIGRKSIYGALYFYPILICIHATCAGIIYYSFPFILIAIALITNALHFAQLPVQTPGKLIRENIKHPYNLLKLVFYWAIAAFAIVALTQIKNYSLHLPLLCLVPLPTIVYILTVRFTNPQNLEVVSADEISMVSD